MRIEYLFSLTGDIVMTLYANVPAGQAYESPGLQ